MKVSGIRGISHLALCFKDISEPYFFFTEILGLKPKFGFSFEGQRVAILGSRGIDIELIEGRGQRENFDSMHIAFRVRDITKAVEQARSGGCRIIRDVYCPTEGIREAMIEGPCGLTVQFVELNLKTLILRSIRGEFRDMKEFPETKA